MILKLTDERRATSDERPRSFSLARRSVRFYWRSHLAVVLGVAAAGAALSGALIVGDSMRGSLREAALSRLCGVTHAVRGTGFFREGLAAELEADVQLRTGRFLPDVLPLIMAAGGLTNADSGARAEGVSILGVDQRFVNLLATEQAESPVLSSDLGRDVVLNEPLARELGVAAGQDVVLRVGRAGDISPETLFGRRDDTIATRRVTVRAVIPAEQAGQFGLDHRQQTPRNAYISLESLQRLIERPGQVNTLLVKSRLLTSPKLPERIPSPGTTPLQSALDEASGLEDLGLRLRVDQALGYASLESEALLLPPDVEAAGRAAALEAGLTAGGVLTYLANDMTIAGPPQEEKPARPAGEASAEAASSVADAPGRSVPYSLVTALDDALFTVLGSPFAGDRLQPGEILLNDWTARELGAGPGQRIRLDYFLTRDVGRIESARAEFVVRAVVPLAGAAADQGFAPEYRGVTDTEDITDWDPPFPVDLGRVGTRDEDYWDRYHTVPKAFLTLADGVKLWAHDAERFGRLTALRLYPPAGQDLHAAAQRFEQALLTRLEAGAGGLRVEPVREQALAAARGNVDFAGLFIGFSSFLILAAALLVALLMRLGVEQRAAELGVLLAVGFTPRRTARVLLTESLWLAAIGALLGLAGARVFAGAMLAGLRGGWSAAVNAPFLQLHVERASLAAGWLATVAVAAVAMFLGVRGLSRQPARALLAGDTGTSRAAATAGRGRLWPAVLAGGALLLAGAAALLPGFPETLGFFGSGALLLAACVLFVRGRLRARPAGFIPRPGWWSIVRLGLRNAPRHAGRSTATVALMACATFVIAAMQAFRLEAGEDVDDPRSGSGGYDMVAESTVPLLADPGTPEGRAALDLPSGAEAALNGVTVMPLRLRPGDDASCTNLYAATQQRIAGAPEAFITRGGFRFSDWLSGTGANPWLLLHHEFEDGAVPAIGDAAAVKWQLHRGLGQDLVVTGGDGRPRRLRFVALLEGSVLQDEIIVSERQFTRLFPQRSGYAFFLIDAPRGSAGAVGTELERLLNRYGFDVRPSSERLAGYFAVQNTYLSVFQSLGGLGLLLGSCGLGAVLLRNVWERRSELAVLRAVGFARRDLGWMVLAENALLVMLGLAAGIVPAAVAVAPHMVHRPQSLALGSLLIILSAVFAASMLSSIAALVSALRAPLVPALRKE